MDFGVDEPAFFSEAIRFKDREVALATIVRPLDSRALV